VSTTSTVTAPLSTAEKSPASSLTTKSSSTTEWPWPSSPSGRSRRRLPIAHLAAPVVVELRPPLPSNRPSASIATCSRAALTQPARPNLSDYFTAEAIADFQSSLAPLGDPLTFHQTSEQLRGGMTSVPSRSSTPASASPSPPTPTPTANWTVPDRSGGVAHSI